MTGIRYSTQALAPARRTSTDSTQYDIYPGFPLEAGKIGHGYNSLVQKILEHVGTQGQITIDGYGGVLWEALRQALSGVLEVHDVQATWIDVSRALKSSEEIERLVQPFLGGDDPLFGTRFTGELGDFYNRDELQILKPSTGLTILYGCGAALAKWDGLLIYVDIPKNEIQFRSRAGSITNLGADRPAESKSMYKRFYFVDWVALNRHKAALLPRIDFIVDEQRPGDPTWMRRDDLRNCLERVSHNFFRVRPWFEPGPWGGQWIKRHITQLPQNVPNYAWSFELISPENGLTFESDGYLLEISFDFLMYYDKKAVVGQSAGLFGYEFPIRFDFLDTFDGGNLSIQCHPRPAYARRHFGELITQDECYYILDCKPDAKVYLGFSEGIDPELFRLSLEQSYAQGTPIVTEEFVNAEVSHKHDLFLIPSGTIHGAGKDNLVLEISATPYIFTFKMYDWLRPDLDGKPRPLNISRAFENLHFERKGACIQRDLVSHPYVLSEGDGWQIIHLPTHQEHFYDVHRLDFRQSIEVDTNDSCHVMSLVEGQSVILETAEGMRQRFNYAETFVVPAAARRYRLINEVSSSAKVIKCFVKDIRALP